MKAHLTTRRDQRNRALLTIAASDPTFDAWHALHNLSLGTELVVTGKEEAAWWGPTISRSLTVQPQGRRDDPGWRSLADALEEALAISMGSAIAAREVRFRYEERLGLAERFEFRLNLGTDL